MAAVLLSGHACPCRIWRSSDCTTSLVLIRLVMDEALTSSTLVSAKYIYHGKLFS